MYTISKDFTWSASHVLDGLPEGHPCGRMHGHNYTARLIITGYAVDATGFLVDYGRLKPFGEYIDTVLDHRHLNDVLDVNPTAENLSRHLRTMALRVIANDIRGSSHRVSVAVSETPKTWATYTVEPG